MFDLKVMNAVLSQMEEERGIPKAKILEAIEMALGTAYKKEFGKKGQIIKASFNLDSGDVEFWQSKIVVEKDGIIMDDEEYDPTTIKEGDEPKPRYNPEHHILIEEARLIKKEVRVGDELNFPLEKKSDFGRIAAQTAKQVITQKIREAEKVSVISEFGEKEGEIVSGTVERIERGTIYLNMGRAVGMLSYDEQIPGERFKQGERVRAYLFRVDETNRGVFLKLSRSHPKFLEELFRAEVPEMSNDTIEIKAIAREAGSRSKIAVKSIDEHVDPVGALVGQRGVRVSTVMSELGGEKIDIIEWSENQEEFIAEALSPAKIIEMKMDTDAKTVKVKVASDQQSLAIGKGGQNVRLAAKLTGWKIDIISDQVQKEDPEVIEVADTTKVADAKEVADSAEVDATEEKL
ncbi:MAG TPA: transcription termination factor NusA [Candidatus Paceibacterota bacterium]|nr:transcription termination factor NusA [Candidatus Paceibacterota bacterium]